MLVSLSVQQFVIVERLDLDIGQGFTVMTGETGAGKSILIDALDLLLGGRGDAAVVREGAAKADLAARFDLSGAPEAQTWLAQAELHSDQDPHELVIRRVVDAAGKSKSWINGQPATLTQLKEIGEQLVDIHGQHAHQALLRPQAQRLLLDAHAGLTESAKTLALQWREVQRLEQAVADSDQQAQALSAVRDQLEWKISEINGLKLSAGEWETLSEEQKRLSHAAELLQSSQSALQQIAEEDPSILTQLEKLQQRLGSLTDKDPRLTPATQALESSVIQLQEAADALQRYLDKSDLDPDRLTEVEERVQSIFSTARKLKVRPEDLLSLLTAAQEDLARATQAADTEALRKSLAKAQQDYDQRARVLSRERQKACKALSEAVNHWFAQLAMGEMRFEATCEPREKPAGHGLEDIVFMLRSHGQGAAFPMSRVASGGELARISLAIAVVTSSSNKTPTLIFDEVDSGIGGNVAHTVGELLRELGQSRQVLCVTHLPQVAARGHHHLRVSKKKSIAGAPISALTPLNPEDRIDEIARMLGDQGAEKTSRDHARSLLAL
ncbi:MAG: DNA repair protein RecN [Betaproteobacteria bacterium]|nr:DNA repair protein RecN [Betaproteobacteria bacterium]